MQSGTDRSSGSGPPERKRRWTAWRNRLVGSKAFQDWASRLPFVRGVARSRAARLFDLVAGFTYTQVLLASVESGLLDLLADGPQSVRSIAEGTALSEPAAERLVRAAAALELAEEVSPGHWMLGMQGAALHANPGAQAMIRHHRLLYADLADPLALLRDDRQAPTALSQFWQYRDTAEAGGSGVADSYSALMSVSQQMVTQQALAAHDFGRYRAVLDVGGGHGAFAMAAAKAHPALRLGIADLPPVLAGTAPRLVEAGLEERIALHPVDFFRDALPGGYDAMSLVRILHDHDDEPALALLKAIRRALPPGGRLVIAEPMAQTPGAQAMGDAYFGFYLWAMRSGRPRSARTIAAMLREAGFARSRQVRTRQPVILSCVVATA